MRAATLCDVPVCMYAPMKSCMCICVHLSSMSCVRVCVYACVRARKGACVHKSTACVCMCACMDTLTNMTSTCVFVRTHAYLRVREYAWSVDVGVSIRSFVVYACTQTLHCVWRTCVCTMTACLDTSVHIS